MSDEQTKGGAETPSGGGQRRPTSRPPWIVVVAALAVALYAVLSIATQIETYRTSCAHTGEFCDGMASLYSAMFTGGMIGSFLIMLCGWKIWAAATLGMALEHRVFHGRDALDIE